MWIGASDSHAGGIARLRIARQSPALAEAVEPILTEAPGKPQVPDE